MKKQVYSAPTLQQVDAFYDLVIIAASESSVEINDFQNMGDLL